MSKLVLTIFLYLISNNCFSDEYEFSKFPSLNKNLLTQPVISKNTEVKLKNLKLTNSRTAYDYLKRKPDFSNEYEIVQWSCGTSCTQSAVINLVSGEIIDFINSCYGLTFKLGSTLLVDSGVENDPSCEATHYYQLKDKKYIDKLK